MGQLNFFRWAIDKGVIAYILAHTEEIEKDMNESFREHYGKGKDKDKNQEVEKTPTGRRKRKAMSKSAMMTVNHLKTPVTVSFD